LTGGIVFTADVAAQTSARRKEPSISGVDFKKLRAPLMIRPWLFGILAGAAAWALAHYQSHRVIPAAVAAEKLRKAWADNHTVA